MHFLLVSHFLVLTKFVTCMYLQYNFQQGASHPWHNTTFMPLSHQHTLVIAKYFSNYSSHRLVLHAPLCGLQHPFLMSAA